MQVSIRNTFEFNRRIFTFAWVNDLQLGYKVFLHVFEILESLTLSFFLFLWINDLVLGIELRTYGFMIRYRGSDDTSIKQLT
jgi:hypothetical protein